MLRRITLINTSLIGCNFTRKFQKKTQTNHTALSKVQNCAKIEHLMILPNYTLASVYDVNQIIELAYTFLTLNLEFFLQKCLELHNI